MSRVVIKWYATVVESVVGSGFGVTGGWFRFVRDEEEEEDGVDRMGATTVEGWIGFVEKSITLWKNKESPKSQVAGTVGVPV